MFTVKCRKELFSYDQDPPVVTPIDVSAAIGLITEPIPGKATCKVIFLDSEGKEVPEFAIWFTTEVPQMYLLEFRRALVGASDKLDELHEVLLLSPEGKATCPQS